MERLYYDASSLEQVILSLERHYKMSSAEFYERHLADDLPEMGSVHRHVWMSFHRDVLRLRDDFAGNAERVLALA